MPCFRRSLIPLVLAAAVPLWGVYSARGVAGEAESAAAGDQQGQDARLLAEVRGIFAHHCYKCHASDKQKGGLRLDTREGVFTGGESGPVVVAGGVDESVLLQRVLLPAGDEDAMPPEGARLDEAQTDLLRKWILGGAPWPDIQAGTFRRAPLALTMPPVPAAEPATDNPVDAFVGAYLAEKNIAWPEPVADELFMRRVYLDVVGLLPSYRDIARFKRDKAGDKRAVLVRELLARDADYALHWMTFWNDALRNDYEGTGYIDGGRTQISNWLYGALVSNKPYDVFTHELVSPVEGSGGFINGIRWRGAVNASQVTEMQAAQSLSQVFLGLNLKCASCHDSFINDWKLADAYALANVFADQPMEVHRCDQATGVIADTQFLFPELGGIDAAASRAERMRQVADLMVAPGNGRTPRTIVNRLWAQFLGRGLVEPVDEMDLAPWSDALLDWLAADLVQHGHDLKHTMERILLSRAYALPSVPVEDPNTLTSEDYVFRGPMRKRLSAEQFADAVSQLVSPLFSAADFLPPAADTFMPPPIPETLNRAKWIWLAGDSGASAAEPGTVFFRKLVKPSFARTILKGEAFLTADNAFEFSVNGESAGAGDNWEKLFYVDFTESIKGRNITVEVRVSNGGSGRNPAGLFGVIVVTYLNLEGKEERLLVPTYRAWESARSADGEFADSEEVALAGEGKPWKELTEVVAMDTGFPGGFVRAVAVKNNPFLVALGRPVRDTVSTGRNSQATLLEALEITNGAFLNAALKSGSELMSGRMRGRTESIVRRVYREFLGRAATEAEIGALKRRLGGDKTTPDAVQDFLWGILVSPEFQIIY